MRGRIWLAGLFVVLLGSGCATAVIHPTQEDMGWARTQWPHITLQELEAGRSLYVRKCAGCHNLHRPDEFGPERWPQLVDKMGAKARIADSQLDLIIQYLSTASVRLRTPPTPEATPN